MNPGGQQQQDPHYGDPRLANHTSQRSSAYQQQGYAPQQHHQQQAYHHHQHQQPHHSSSHRTNPQQHSYNNGYHQQHHQQQQQQHQQQPQQSHHHSHQQQSHQPQQSQAPQQSSHHHHHHSGGGGGGSSSQPQQGHPHNQMLYSAEKLAGSGSFGLVYQARVIDPVTGAPGETVAIKKVYLDPDFKNRELQIMSELRHPCVVTLRHCFYIQDPATNKTYMNLVMSFVPENIHTHIRANSRKGTPIKVDLVRRYIYQILRGLAYVHAKGICHRDLKPHNILINSSTHEVKLCDFGSAKCLRPEENNVSYICSRFYRAPELALGARRYTTAVDMWSAGCVFAELITTKPLFAGVAPEDQIISIIQILGFPAPEDYARMEVKQNDALAAIASAQRNPSRASTHRPVQPGHLGTGLAHALGSNCPATALDLLKHLLAYDPTNRIKAFDALAHPFFELIHRPYDFYLCPETFHWEIEQHQWTEDEAAAIAKLKDIKQRAMLFPPWLKAHTTKHIQHLAGYPEIEEYHHLVREQRQMRDMAPPQSTLSQQDDDKQWEDDVFPGDEPQAPKKKERAAAVQVPGNQVAAAPATSSAAGPTAAAATEKSDPLPPDNPSDDTKTDSAQPTTRSKPDAAPASTQGIMVQTGSVGTVPAGTG